MTPEEIVKVIREWPFNKDTQTLGELAVVLQSAADLIEQQAKALEKAEMVIDGWVIIVDMTIDE